MAQIKIVGIKDLKNNLSAYLRDVRRGTRILVSDRHAVVAELHEPTSSYARTDSVDPVLADWIEHGVVTVPLRKKAPLPRSPVRLPASVVAQLLAEDRDEGDR
jgi:antitoxin (DNA-binding transcriptional repressor) of toxin-antitoxin stability system